MSIPPTAISPPRPEVVTDGYSERRPGWVQLATSGDH